MRVYRLRRRGVNSRKMVIIYPEESHRRNGRSDSHGSPMNTKIGSFRTKFCDVKIEWEFNLESLTDTENLVRDEPLQRGTIHISQRTYRFLYSIGCTECVCASNKSISKSLGSILRSVPLLRIGRPVSAATNAWHAVILIHPTLVWSYNTHNFH